MFTKWGELLLKQHTGEKRFPFKGLLVILLAFVATGAWVFASPVGSSPDDDFHLTSIWCSGDGVENLCERISDDQIQRAVTPAFVNSACFAHIAEKSASCQQDLAVFSPGQTLVTSGRGNFASSYPPVFYAFMHLFAGSNIELSALIMRAVNTLLFIGLAVILWLLVNPHRRALIFLIWTSTMVPLGLFIIASNNPSSWAVIGVGTLFVALLSFYETNKTKKKLLAAVSLVSAIVASGARADAGIYVGVCSLAVAAYQFPLIKANWRQCWLPFLTTIIGLIFFANTQQAAVASQGFGNDVFERNPISVLFFNIVELPSLWMGVFGQWGLGWLDTGMPTIVWASGSVVFASLIVISWAHMARMQKFLFLGTWALTILLPLYILQKSLAHVGEFLQPRYLLPLFIILIGIPLATLVNTRSLDDFWFRLSFVIFVGFSESLSLFMNIRRYTFGAGKSIGTNLDSGYLWWWAAGPTPMTVWALGSVSFLLLCIFLLFGKNRIVSTSIESRQVIDYRF